MLPFTLIFLFPSGVLVVRPDSGNPPEVVVKVLNILCKLDDFNFSQFLAKMFSLDSGKL